MNSNWAPIFVASSLLQGNVSCGSWLNDRKGDDARASSRTAWIAKAFAQPEVKERFAALGFQPVANTPDDYAAYIRAEIPRWGKVVRAASIRID
jgi:tripartite-type tricarboxylate transporter receptor subunit TctC